MELEGKPTVMVHVSWRWVAIAATLCVLGLISVLGQVLAGDRSELKAVQKEQAQTISELQKSVANQPTRDDLRELRQDMRLLSEHILQLTADRRLSP